MMKIQNRIGRLLTLLCPILLTGCHSFTLIGSVNLGMQDNGGDANAEGQTGHDDAGQDKCWPSSRAAVAEMRSHGYTFTTWPKTAEWFADLEPLAKSLPPCS
jgi:hypothetical protein